MKIPFIDLKSQYLLQGDEIRARINKVFEHGQFIMGPEVEEVEGKLSEFVGSKYCITTSSGTDALLISLMALGIGPGDEVITTPFTFVATVEVIALLGATPVFVDIESDTCNINAQNIESKINIKTKAIIPVSLFGQPADMDEINLIASLHGEIPVIEDAAQSFGATYKKKKSCNLSTIGCTSFFPSKPLGCYGDGGAIFTSDESIAQSCREIRLHGQSERYIHSRIGIGGRMDTLQCAVLLGKIKYFEDELELRKKIGMRYNALLDKLNFPRVIQRENRSSVFAQYTIFTNARKKLQGELQAAGIPTAVHYPVPLNEQSAYRHFCCPSCTPISKIVSDKVLSLPMGPYLKDEDQKMIVDLLERIQLQSVVN